MVLTHTQAQHFYDRFGKKLDTQSFYEDAALDELIAHAAFGEARSIFEFGCGTGRFAERLLAEHLAPSATYFGLDISPTMIGLATERLAHYAERAQVLQSDGAIQFPLPDHAVDRIVIAYVLDILSESDARQAIAEARRTLAPAGKLCLVSLSSGVTLASRLVTTLWSAAFRLHAPMVGGCRPILLETLLVPDDWSIEYRNVITQFGVPSEVLIASPR